MDFKHIRNLVPLAAVLSRYGVMVDLKRAGSQLRGCCPIHDGTNPEQFVVDLANNSWHCFGDCKRGGGTLEFVAYRERVPIPRAAELIAQWFAINISSSTATSTKSERKSPMTGRPSHRAYVVEDREAGNDEQGGFWTKIGSAWPHKDGKGLNIVLAALPANGRIVLREYTEEDAKADEGKRKPAKK